VTVDLSKLQDCFVEPFGEWIHYIPNGGNRRRIKASVTRNPPESLDQTPGDSPPLPLAVLVVKNNFPEGIQATEINLGVDKVEYAVRVGEDPTEHTITELLGQDEAALTLEVR
jgi:hypothetical protein